MLVALLLLDCEVVLLVELTDFEPDCDSLVLDDEVDWESALLWLPFSDEELLAVLVLVDVEPTTC